MKDDPITPNTQEIPRIWGAVSQELWMNTKYIFLTNHSISPLSLLSSVMIISVCFLLTVLNILISGDFLKWTFK